MHMQSVAGLRGLDGVEGGLDTGNFSLCQYLVLLETCTKVAD